jgi:hypothetical protein
MHHKKLLVLQSEKSYRNYKEKNPIIICYNAQSISL